MLRALESFYEAEQIRLALRDTLRVQRAVHNADAAASDVSRPCSRASSRNTGGTGIDTEEDLDSQEASEDTSRRKLEPTEGWSLVGLLPDPVVLDEIVANYLDIDTIMLVLPKLSHDWRSSIWGITSGALLWKRLCLRAWEPLNLPIQRLLATSAGNDWQIKFFKRPRIRLTGPYMTYTVFIQNSGPRSMWTPKDAPGIKVIYHHRFWWFREGGRVCYIALATRNPRRIIEAMRKEVMGEGVQNPEVVFWYGTYNLYREDNTWLCDVDVPHARHGVKFLFELCPGGGAIKILRHQSYRFKTPLDLMFHTLPDYEEDRHYKYQPGFL